MFSFSAYSVTDLYDQQVDISKGHKTHAQGGVAKAQRILKNEQAIAALMKEVQSLKQEIKVLKEKMPVKK